MKKLLIIACLGLMVAVLSVACMNRGKVKSSEPCEVVSSEVIYEYEDNNPKAEPAQNSLPNTGTQVVRIDQETEGGKAGSENGGNIDTKPSAEAEKAADSPFTDAQWKMLQRTKGFSFRLFDKAYFKVADEHGSPCNFVISPVSVELLTAMLLNGADGATAAEMSKTLGFDVKDLPSANELYHTLMQLLPKADDKVTLNVANAMVVNQKMPLLGSFVTDARNYYGAEVTNMNFNNSDAVAKKINSWCAEQTNGLIPKIIDRVTPDMSACAMNAVYFKGEWRNPFKPERTVKKDFLNVEGHQVKLVSQVEMMIQQERFHYAETELAQWLCLPYGNGRFSMIVVLPKWSAAAGAGDVLDWSVGEGDLVKRLDPEIWAEAMGKMRRTLVNVWLPKFETKCHLPLNEIMKDLGMQQAFAPSANFGKLSKVPSFISSMQQDAIIKVYEEGSEAAAVTSAYMKATSVAMPQKPVDFHANHGFLYFIVEEQSGSVLFAGAFSGRE